MAEDGGESPFENPEAAPDLKREKNSGRPVKGSRQAYEAAQRMTEGRRRKKEERERAAAAGGGTTGGPSTKSAPAARSTATTTPAALRADLKDGLDKVGAMLLIPAPVPGTYIANTSDELSAIVGRMAERNPKLLAMLEGSSNMMDYVALGAWGLGMVVATGVQVGQVRADAPVARVTGITKIVEDLAEAGIIDIGPPPDVIPLREDDDQPATDGGGAFEAFQAADSEPPRFAGMPEIPADADTDPAFD